MAMVTYLYEKVLEPLLFSWKQRLSLWIRKQKLQRVVDICCGTGKQCRMVAEHTRVIGLDLNISFLRYAKSVTPHIDFVCGDAEQLPFKSEIVSATILSLALHDKPPATRYRMISEAKRITRTNGFHFFIDFEQPNSGKSRLGYAFVYLIELFAGWQHFRNGRQFVKSGGLLEFLNQQHLPIKRRHFSASGSSSIVQCRR